MSTTLPSSKTPILVVGAGPVGLVLAIDLARRGVPVRIIDRLHKPTTESRAIVIHARSLDQLEVLGVTDRLLGTGILSTGVQFHSENKELARIPFDAVHSRHPFSLTTSQTETERVLRERLRALGVQIERGVTLVGLKLDDESVEASVRRSDGTYDAISASWLVGTDGAHSTVRGLMKQRLEGSRGRVSTKGENFLLGDVDADFDYDLHSMHIFFSPGDTTGLLFPMVGGRARVFAQIPEGVDVDREPSLEWLAQALADRHMELRIKATHWLARFEIQHAQVSRYRVGRLLLAGDAAHIHSPAGGQGMNTGFQDALNLSWKLALATRGHASQALLDSYHAERHPVAERAISFTTALTRIGTAESWLLRQLRNNAMKLALRLSAPQRALANKVEEQDVNYRSSPVIVGLGTRVRGGDYLQDSSELLVTSTLQSTEVAERVLHVGVLVPDPAGKFPAFTLPEGVKVVTASEGNPELAERLGLARTGGLILVRPDGYIGLIASASHTHLVGDYFARLTQESSRAAA